MDRAPRRLRVFLTMPDRSLVRSTDRDYVHHRLPKLAERWPVDFVPNRAWVSRAYDDGRHALNRALGLVLRRYEPPEHIWSVAPFPDDVDLAYAYGQFPRNFTRHTPIVWQQTFAPIGAGGQLGHETEYGSSHIARDAWRRVIVRSRREAVARAARIVVPSAVSRDHAVSLFPEARARVSVLPYYLPGLEPVEPAAIAARGDTTQRPVRLLFVGKEARRKGLGTLVGAWQMLDEATRARLSVTVVSKLIDGPMVLPPEWSHHGFVEDLYALMAGHDVLVFPTRHEAYGLVLVEAMARGLAVVTTSAEVQREIVGSAGGLFVDPFSVRELAAALRELVHDPARLPAMATANRARFVAEYWHEVVGPAHMAVFAEVS